MDTGPLAVIGIIVFIHSFLALTASVAVFRDNSLDYVQLIGKLLVCWLFIFIGPLTILKLISEYSPEILPKIATTGPLAYLLFAKLNPSFHCDNPKGVVDDQPLFERMEDAWGDDVDGSCGSAGD